MARCGVGRSFLVSGQRSDVSDLFLKLHPCDDVLIARAQLISWQQAGDIKVRGEVRYDQIFVLCNS